jgi:hypothetical protein
MKLTWGKFTARGGPEVEARITRLVTAAANVVQQAVAPDLSCALVLIGGYGRGEGGVERRANEEVPHNNLDLLLITTRELGNSPLKAQLAALLEPLGQAAGIRLDLSLCSLARLRRAPPRVIWCDMRFGHKTLWGDPALVPGMKHFDPERIPPADVRNLLVNRGTLLLINHLLLNRTAVSLEDQRLVIRHAMKAIIGYGDALLFQRGDYHWSYLEKQRRMSRRSDIPETFRRLYDEAMEFRFRPCYAAYGGRDLAAWTSELCGLLAPLHLFYESWRLGVELADWDAYPTVALRHALGQGLTSPRAWGRTLLHGWRGKTGPRTGSWIVRLSARCCGPADTLPILFPLAAYGSAGAPARALAQAILGAPNPDPETLRVAYLRQWGTHIDTNFAALLPRLGLILDPEHTA